ncbi:MAG: 3'-5' exonuclease [Anaerolineae bacterium]
MSDPLSIRLGGLAANLARASSVVDHPKHDPSPGDYLGNITFAVLDVETTGLSAASGHRICEIALLRWRGGKVLESFESLIDPQRSISPGAAAVNGLSDFQIRGQPLFDQVAEQVQAMLAGAVLVAHNAAFDLSFLAAEWRRLRWPPLLGLHRGHPAAGPSPLHLSPQQPGRRGPLAAGAHRPGAPGHGRCLDNPGRSAGDAGRPQPPGQGDSGPFAGRSGGQCALA